MVRYFVSQKKVPFSTWQEKNIVTTVGAVAVEVGTGSPPVPQEMRREERDLATKLKDLKEIYDAGGLTAEEYTSAKKRIIHG